MNKTELLKLQIFAYLGKPYIWGGSDPIAGFDCSGFILELLKSIGLWPNKKDATSQQICDFFKAVPNLAPGFGSLLFFGKTPYAITHVAMALSDRMMVEAGGGGSTTLTEKDAAAQDAYVRIRPISMRSDLQAIHHLNLGG